MRKIFVGFVTAAIALNALVMTIFAADSSKYDVNGDGSSNAKDATYVLKMAVDLIPKDSRGDVNGDGYINAKDATAILKYAAGIDESVSDPAPVTDIAAKYEAEVVRLVNIEREKEGLAPLTMDSELNKACDIRANEVSRVFSHTRPNGKSCYTVLDEYGIGYYMCGENIAYGSRTPAAVVEVWMNSEGHRSNILNPGYKKIGVGFENYNWVQIFTD